MNACVMHRLRPWVQGLSLAVLVWGFYMAEKLSNALVKLHTVTVGMVMPLVFTMLTFLAFFMVLNKAFCGWVCPLGTAQEVLYKLGRLPKLDTLRLPLSRRPAVSSVKWVVLVLFIPALPLVSGMGYAPHEFRDPWCQVCLSRMVTTLLTGDGEQVALPLKDNWVETTFTALCNLFFGFGAMLALSFRQPFCRICPMLSLHALFRRFAPLRLTKKAFAGCERCGLCAKACPMDITVIQSASGSAVFHQDCTLCDRCVAFCPHDDVLSIAFGPLPLVKSSKSAFARVTRRESPVGDRKRQTARSAP